MVYYDSAGVIGREKCFFENDRNILKKIPLFFQKQQRNLLFIENSGILFFSCAVQWMFFLPFTPAPS